MNKKTAGRISAMAMASMMMMSVCVVNAAAEENEPITQLNLKKTVTTDGNTYQPNTSFSFHVENGEAAENWRDNVVYAGVTGGIKATQTIGFQPSGEDTLAAVYSKNATLEINAEVFEHAGVYHYVVTEDAGSYEGIDYDTAGRDVYLFVYNGADGALYDRILPLLGQQPNLLPAETLLEQPEQLQVILPAALLVATLEAEVPLNK